MIARASDLSLGPARRLAGDAERGLAQPPQRVGREADAEQPERDQPVGFAREQLQGALLVRLARAVPQRDQHRDPADQDVDDTARGQARTGQEVCRRAVGGPPCGARYVRRRYRVHTRHYLVSRSANMSRDAGSSGADADRHRHRAEPDRRDSEQV